MKESQSNSEAIENSPVQYSVGGFDVEETVALFLSENYVKAPPILLRRINVNGRRLYFYIDVEGKPQFFISVTTFIKAAMPTSPFLIKWIAEKGYDEAQAYSEERAHYGTFLHIQTGQLLIDSQYDLDGLTTKLEAYMKANSLPLSFMNYAEDLKRDVMSFAQFCIDVNYKPIAIEMVLCHPEYGYGGALDHVGVMDVEEKGFFGEVYKSGPRKGEKKETKQKRRAIAIIDVKSGRKDFYDEHEVQLEAYKEAWEYWFPDLPIERLYNWSPKNWRKTPTYNLKDQTGSVSREKLTHLVSLAKIDDKKYDKRVTVLRGIIKLENGQDGLADNVFDIELSQAIIEEEERRAAAAEIIEELDNEPLFPEDEIVEEKPAKPSKKAKPAKKAENKPNDGKRLPGRPKGAKTRNKSNTGKNQDK